MARALRERLELTQDRIRTLARELESVPSGPESLPTATQEALDRLRAATLQLEREGDRRETALARARERRNTAENDFLRARAARARADPRNPPAKAIIGGCIGGLACAVRLATDSPGAQHSVLTRVLVVGLTFAWLVYDGWYTGRVSSAEQDPFSAPPP